jgi:hypothetical protein
MTMPEFDLLPYNEKIELLYRQGVYIGKHKGSVTRVLYQVDSFYVEIYYKKYRRIIDHLQCFTGTDRLNPYLWQINVEDIIKCVE